MPRIRDMMTRKVVTVGEEVPLLEASQLLVSERIGGAPVVDNQGRVIGILSESDVLRALKKPLTALSESESRDKRYKGIDAESMVKDALGFLSLDWLWYRWNIRAVDRVFKSLHESEAISVVRVKDAMTPTVVSISQEDTIEMALDLMNERDINRLPVLDQEKRLVGIVARTDLLKAVSNEMSEGAGEAA